MPKINDITTVSLPKLSDKLVGTSVGGTPDNQTYNFTLQQLKDLFGESTTITLTTTGSSGASTLVGSVLNVPNYTLSGLGGVPSSRALSINGTSYDLSADRVWNVGSVTSVAALSLGTVGTDLSSSVATGTTTPVITLNVPTASATNRGALSSADWVTFNSKGSGTVTSVSALTIGLVGTDITSTVASGTTTPVITLNIPTASSTNRGALSSTDWINFDGKQNAGNYITSLLGEATAAGPGAASITLNNASVTGKLLTGLNVTGGTVVATDSMLTGFGKLQNQINGLVGGVVYQGTWNASANTPTLTSSVGTNGYYYVVDVAGSTNLNGITDWKVGDWAIFHGSTWQKVDNTDAVTSVNGQVGAVSLTTDNIPEGTTNLYYLNSRARAAISLTTTGSSGVATYDSVTGVLNIPNYTTDLSSYVTIDTTQTITGDKTFTGTSIFRTNNFENAVEIKDNTSYGVNSGSTTINTERALTVSSVGFNFGSTNKQSKFNFTNTDNYAYTFPAASGTIALTSDIPAAGLSSVGVSMPSAFSVANSPLTADGTIAITGAGTTAEYIRGDGSLAAFPSVSSESQRLITEVYNSSGATLTKGTVVYINGGQGNLPTVTKALATGDATSAQTYGVVQANITNMNNGFVVVIGSLTNLDTQAYLPGTQLYLSSTVAGEWTSVKQYAPAHLVYVGIVVRQHPTQGVVEVKIQNGFEMDELHNVSAQNPSDGDILQYVSSTDLWTAVPLPASPSVTNAGTGTCSIVGSGLSNTACGDYSAALSGQCNTACGTWSLVGGGSNNTVSSCYASTISGGCYNTICSNQSFIGSGSSNTICSSNSSIGGGYYNTICFNSGCSTVSGGYCNTIYANSNGSAIVGGQCNITGVGGQNFIGSGSNNYAGNAYSIVVGGGNNYNVGMSSFIGGGTDNGIGGWYSSVTGGRCNLIIAGGDGMAIVGGLCNKIFGGGFATFIGGGIANCTSSGYSSIVGGIANCIFGGPFATILGGCCNTASGYSSSVLGGSNNITNADYSAVFGCGLTNNNACTFMANNFVIGDFVGCGGCSLALDANGKMCIGAGGGGGGGIMVLGTGCNSTIRCGVNNVACGDYSASLGGQCNSVSGYTSTISGGYHNTISGGYSGTYLCSCSFIGGGGCNNVFSENSVITGGFFSSICNSCGSAIVGGINNNIINSQQGFIGSGSGNYLGNSYVTAIVSGEGNVIRCNGYSFIGHGSYNCVVTADFSSVLGGFNNKIEMTQTPPSYPGYASISGGCCNTVCGNYSFIGGGSLNTNQGLSSFIGGGSSNTASEYLTTITGGGQNSIYSPFSSIGGGYLNSISGAYDSSPICAIGSTIGGGWRNTIYPFLSTSSAIYSTIAGGKCNTACGNYSFIGGGSGNVTSGNYSGAFGCNLNASAACTMYFNNVCVCGTLSKVSGSFKIPHPDPIKSEQGKFLKHSFVESPTAGDNIYRFNVTAINCSASIQLPDYYSLLNSNDQVFVNAKSHLGYGFGVVNEAQTEIDITTNSDGEYNVLLIGTRKDKLALDAWNGTEVNDVE